MSLLLWNLGVTVRVAIDDLAAAEVLSETTDVAAAAAGHPQVATHCLPS